MKEKLSILWGKDGTKSVLASLISIVIGMAVGALIVFWQVSRERKAKPHGTAKA